MSSTCTCMWYTGIFVIILCSNVVLDWANEDDNNTFATNEHNH